MHLTFKAKDRYSGEHVLNEKEALHKTLTQLGLEQPHIEVLFTGDAEEEDRLGGQAEIIKRVFRGEIVQGD